MLTSNKSLLIKGKNLTLLASIICVSALTIGCNDEQLTSDKASVSTTNNTREVKTADEKVEKAVVKVETNADRVSRELVKKVEQAKEDLKSFDAEVVSKKPTFQTEDTADYKQEVQDGSHEIWLHNLYVVDGDTIHGLDENDKIIKVRMTGIDAPESSQPMGEESRQSLVKCVSDSKKALVVVQNNNATDKYGRTLGRVESTETDCNQYQIENGMAWFYEDYSDKLGGDIKGFYKSTQDRAKENQVGIWSMDLQKPWDYRKENK